MAADLVAQYLTADSFWFAGGSAQLNGGPDPSAGAGVNAPLGSLYQRWNGQLWTKTGAADTAWTQVPTSTGITLDGAYDFGGAGAGRSIAVDANLPVLFNAVGDYGVVHASGRAAVQRPVTGVAATDFPAAFVVGPGDVAASPAIYGSAGREIVVAQNNLSCQFVASTHDTIGAEADVNTVLFAQAPAAAAQGVVGTASDHPLQIITDNQGAWVVDNAAPKDLIALSASSRVNTPVLVLGEVTAISGAFTNALRCIEAPDGQNTPVAPVNTGRLRYNMALQQWEQSANAGAYTAFGSGASGAGVTSNLWSPPATPHADDVEFESVSAPAGWSFSAGPSVTAIDPYDTGFAAGDPRVEFHTNRRRSWMMVQPPGDGSPYYLHKAYTLPTNLLFWARLAFNSRNASPANNDFSMSIMICASSAGAPDPTNSVQMYINESDAGIVQAEAQAIEGGVVQHSDVTADIYGTNMGGQPLEYVAIHKVGTSYHYWVANAAGSWISLGTRVYAGAAVNRVAIRFLNAATGAPGAMIMGCDFLRFVESATFLP